MDVEPFLRFFAAAIFAGAIGLDRELRAKPAGLRTNIVVGVASAAFAYVSVTAFPDFGSDNSRVASQIVTGIGFLGGGAIFAAGGKPHGLTTAAALWGSAAAGLAAGVGSFVAGAALVVITLIALWPLDMISGVLFRGHRSANVNFTVIVDGLSEASEVRHAVRTAGADMLDLRLEPFADQVTMTFVLHGTLTAILDATDRLRASENVAFVSEGPMPGKGSF
jgi:putative Mg2+ transporter-C (MgtC) family protein